MLTNTILGIVQQQAVERVRSAQRPDIEVREKDGAGQGSSGKKDEERKLSGSCLRS